MWRVIWTPLGGTFPDHADWDHREDAAVCKWQLEGQGITDATIHNLGDTE